MKYIAIDVSHCVTEYPIDKEKKDRASSFFERQQEWLVMHFITYLIVHLYLVYSMD